jgi:hypothetical protein
MNVTSANSKEWKKVRGSQILNINSHKYMLEEKGIYSLASGSAYSRASSIEDSAQMANIFAICVCKRGN